jgi:PAS domain S-box-containing protein
MAKAGKWILAASLLAVGGYLVATRNQRAMRERVYRIGWESDPPFQQRGADGAPTGLAVELVRKAAERQGIRLEWVWRPANSEVSLRSNRVDLWPLMTITLERRQFVHISDPYLQHEHSFMVRAGSPYLGPQDLAHATVTHYDQAIDYRLARKALPDAKLVARPSLRDAIEEVCQHRADAAYTEEFSGLSALLGGPSCAGQPLRIISVPGLRTKLGVGSTFGASAVADRIREGIGDVGEVELTRLMTQWGYFSPRNLETMNALLNARRRERWLTAAIGLFALLFALALFEADRIRRQRNRIKKTEAALRESEQKLRLMANNLTEMVMSYDMNRNLIYVNHAVEGLTGYSVAELHQQEFVCWVHPDDRSRMLGHWDDLFRGVAFQDEEYRLVTKCGQEKWAIASWGPIFEHGGRQVGVQGSEREITERKHAEQALRESERRFRELLESVQLVAVMIDLNGYICFCNQHALTITGWTEDEVIGHPASQFLDTKSQQEIGEVLDFLRRTGRPRPFSESRILTKKGEGRWIQWSSAPLRDAAGRTIGFASLGTDVTEHRELQDQYVQAQKLECAGRLAGGIAHDFNNLLVVINGYSDLILEQLYEDHPLRESIDAIRRAGQRAAELTHQLLAFGRKQAFRKQPLDLNILVRNSERMLATLLGEDIDLATVLEPSLGLIRADPGQMDQILMNLVLNARDAMPDGGGLIIQTANVEFGQDALSRHPGMSPGDYVLLKVMDTGVGMDEQTLQHIFDPFFTTKPEGKGTGLGLASVFGIVKQTEGWIWVSSEPGKGTTFEVYLPRTGGRVEPEVAVASATGRCRSSGTVLLVEDQEDVRRLTSEVLETCGYQVLTAGDGGAALLVSQRHPGPIDLMLSDVVMPGMKGPELARQIKSLRPEMKVLFMSGYVQKTGEAGSILDTDAECLSKPFSPRTLADKVREVLEAAK